MIVAVEMDKEEIANELDGMILQVNAKIDALIRRSEYLASRTVKLVNEDERTVYDMSLHRGDVKNLLNSLQTVAS